MPSCSHSSKISRSTASRSRRQGEASSGLRAKLEGDEGIILKIVRPTHGSFVATKLPNLTSGHLDQPSPSMPAIIQSLHNALENSSHVEHGHPLPPSIDLPQSSGLPLQGSRTRTLNVPMSMPTASINVPTQKRTPMTTWHNRNRLLRDQLTRQTPPIYAIKLILLFSRNHLRSPKTS